MHGIHIERDSVAFQHAFMDIPQAQKAVRDIQSIILRKQALYGEPTFIGLLRYMVHCLAADILKF